MLKDFIELKIRWGMRARSRAKLHNSMKSSGHIALRVLPLQGTPMVVVVTFHEF